uniref:WESB_1763 family membrane protein n=1 Tax=Brachyspira sp. TaxID=1977261 RepID=UPI003D7DFC93
INNNNNSFINKYNFWANIFLIAVLFNFLFFRVLFLDISGNSFIYIINYIINYSIFIIFFLLLFYKFYGYLFNSQIVNGILGIIFLITGTLKLYISDINIYNIVELLFFIFTFIITIKTLLLIILLKNINELERGIYIFIFTALAFSNFSYILFSINKIVDDDIVHYVSLFLTSYMEKVASLSFIIIMISYIIIFIPKYWKTKIKYFIFGLAIVIFSFILMSDKYNLIIIYFYNALGVGINFPFIFYAFLTVAFIFTLFSFLSASIISKKYSAEFIILTLFILAGIDMSDFTLRLISIFSAIEMTEIILNSLSIDRDY